MASAWMHNQIRAKNMPYYGEEESVLKNMLSSVFVYLTLFRRDAHVYGHGGFKPVGTMGKRGDV